MLPKFLTKVVCQKQPKSVQPAQPTGQSCQKTNFKKTYGNFKKMFSYKLLFLRHSYSSTVIKLNYFKQLFFLFGQKVHIPAFLSHFPIKNKHLHKNSFKYFNLCDVTSLVLNTEKSLWRKLAWYSFIFSLILNDQNRLKYFPFVDE